MVSLPRRSTIVKIHFAEKTTYRGDKCYMSKCQNSCAAEMTTMPPTYPKYFADASKDFADASKIFRRRVQGFCRHVQNILPTCPKYFADTSMDFADASKIFRRRVQGFRRRIQIFHRRRGNAADATSYRLGYGDICIEDRHL